MSVRPLMPQRLAGLANAPHALPYQGSKRHLAHAIVRLLPLDTARLLEPFAGSAAVAIAARHLGIGRTAEISDVNEPLIGLWQAILDDPLALAADYERLWSQQLGDPRGFYQEMRARFNATHEPHHLLYLLARCVKAAVRYNRDGDFNQGADNRRLGARPAAMRTRLVETSRTLAGSRAFTADYAGVLRAAEPDDVVYMDPPYQGVTAVRDRRYVAGLPREQFLRELQAAVDRGVSFLLSYDGTSGDRRYGEQLPDELNLLHLNLSGGRSSQGTLNGVDARTVEALYLSPAAARRLGGPDAVVSRLGRVSPLWR